MHDGRYETLARSHALWVLPSFRDSAADRLSSERATVCTVTVLRSASTDDTLWADTVRGRHIVVRDKELRGGGHSAKFEILKARYHIALMLRCRKGLSGDPGPPRAASRRWTSISGETADPRRGPPHGGELRQAAGAIAPIGLKLNRPTCPRSCKGRRTVLT